MVIRAISNNSFSFPYENMKTPNISARNHFALYARFFRRTPAEAPEAPEVPAPVLPDTVLLVGAGSDFFLVVERVRDGARSGPEGDAASTSTTISSLPFAVLLELSVLLERSSTNASSSLVSSELCRLDDPCRLHSDTDSGLPCRDMELKSD